MRRVFGSRPIMTEETHRATTFEVFFDIVFVFAVTRVIEFIGQPPTALTMARALILLLLLWMAWTTFTWLGNQAHAGVGLIAGGMTLAMAAIFVAALVIPDAWQHRDAALDSPLILALAYIVLRVLDLALYFHVAGGDRQMRTTLRLFGITATLAWIPLVVGALLHGHTQTLLWAGAFVIDFGGGFIASALSGWRLRSPSHFTERHGLVVIIAIGESLISTGVGLGSAAARGPILVAALLGFTVSACLWRLYFKNPAMIAAGQALARVARAQRGRLASNAYSLAHFPLIAGVIYTAVGIEDVLARLVENQPGHHFGRPLALSSSVALYGGVTVYLAGRVLFLRFIVRSTPPGQAVAAAVALLLVPVASILPAIAALGLLTAFLVALVWYEWLRSGEQRLAAGGP